MARVAVALAACGMLLSACSSSNGSATTSATPTSKPTATQALRSPSATPTAAAYVYKGPQYKIVVEDPDQGPAKLTQYWVLTAALNYSTPAYKTQIKSIITDIAHAQGTDKLIVAVVTNKDIALAEAASTYEQFVQDHGNTYAIKTIPKMEVAGWIANYTGGFDYNNGVASDAADAYEVLWRPYATSESEKWKPAIAN